MTVTMTLQEYQILCDQRTEAQNELVRYKKALETVYGKEKADYLLEQANNIEDQKNRYAIQRAVIEGKL